jgi:hypothetical protein
MLDFFLPTCQEKKLKGNLGTYHDICCILYSPWLFVNQTESLVSCSYQGYSGHLLDFVERNFNFLNNSHLCYYWNGKKRKSNFAQ